MSGKITVIVGSKTDLVYLKKGLDALKKLKIRYSLDIISAHRNPEKLRKFCGEFEKRGVEVVIAGAGKAAALPGFIASYTDIPVIGVAFRGGLMDGMDALFSIVSAPKGLGLVCSGVGASAFINVLIFALQILSLKDKKFNKKLKSLKDEIK